MDRRPHLPGRIVCRFPLLFLPGRGGTAPAPAQPWTSRLQSGPADRESGGRDRVERKKESGLIRGCRPAGKGKTIRSSFLVIPQLAAEFHRQTLFALATIAAGPLG